MTTPSHQKGQPVAWLWVEDPWGANEHHVVFDDPKDNKWTPLYTAPPEQGWREDALRLAREATDYLHAVSVLFQVQPEGDCLAERKPTKDVDAYRAFVYLNDQGKLLRAAIDAATKSPQGDTKEPTT